VFTAVEYLHTLDRVIMILLIAMLFAIHVLYTAFVSLAPCLHTCCVVTVCASDRTPLICCCPPPKVVCFMMPYHSNLLGNLFMLAHLPCC
jgi:hypothetical protein